MIKTLLVGLLIGFLAKWIMPGKDPGDGKGFVGILITIGIGILGSWIGSLVFGLLGFTTTSTLWALISGIVGALIFLYLYRLIMKKKNGS